MPRSFVYGDIVRQGEVQSVKSVGITEATRTLTITTVIETVVMVRQR